MAEARFEKDNTMNMTIDRSSGPLRRPLHRGTASLLALALAATALTGCAASGNPAGETAQAPAASAETGATEQIAELKDGWAKAADSNMTSVFGSLENTGDQAVTLTSIAAADTADVAELHETVMNHETGATEMKRVQGGFEIGPGETKTLEPGGDHIMLMELKCAVKSGTDLSLDLGFSDGRTQEITVPVRDYAGAQEHYAPGEEHSGHGEHSRLPGAEPSALPQCHEH